MSGVANGDKVKVQYKGKLPDGRVVDASKKDAPLEFTIGNGQVIPGFEKNVMGMETGEIKIFTLQPEEAFGKREQELVVEVDKRAIPLPDKPAVGRRVAIPVGAEKLKATIADMKKDTITLDANHPLAGKSLLYEVKLLEILG
jgi:FKBP-type peptidyl-prolyl cis-trans isomerase 2